MNTLQRKSTLIVNDQMHIALSMLKDTERYLLVSAHAKTKAIDWFTIEILARSFTVNTDYSRWKQAV